MKKTGIIVAAVATGLIGLSPLAFAADDVRDNGRATVSEDSDTRTTTDNSVEQGQYNRCSFEQEQRSDSRFPVPTGGPASGDQMQMLNCTNMGDVTVLDMDGEESDVAVTPPAQETPSS